MLVATTRLLDELADDQALSMRAVAREVGVAATSVYLHFPDRDALVVAALERCHRELAHAVDEAEASAADPVARLRARLLVLSAWACEHAGLYKVMYESTLNRRAHMAFKRDITDRTVEAVQRCMDAGSACSADPVVVAFDLRCAVHGAVSMHLNQPEEARTSLDEQIDRFLRKLVGIR